MNLSLVNNIVNNMKNKKFIESFLDELQNFLQNSSLNSEKEEMSLFNPTHNGIKITSKYRDLMLIERANILNNYASQTLDKGQMYYIYDNNSKMEFGYNIYACEEGKSHSVIELSKDELPDGAKVGSVLRSVGNEYIIDEKATIEIEQEISSMKEKYLNEQTEFLQSKRIEGHIYEMSENDGDRAWLFDITNNSDEGIEEIDFPSELLDKGKEGDLYIFKNGEYQKYLN